MVKYKLSNKYFNTILLLIKVVRYLNLEKELYNNSGTRDYIHCFLLTLKSFLTITYP